MKTNVKPGDLAIVVWATRPENIGKIVTVIAPAIRASHPLSPTNEVYLWNGDSWVARGTGWVVRAEGSPIVSQEVCNGIVIHSAVRPVADCHLRPLRDDEIQDEAERTLETAS